MMLSVAQTVPHRMVGWSLTNTPTQKDAKGITQGPIWGTIHECAWRERGKPPKPQPVFYEALSGEDLDHTVVLVARNAIIIQYINFYGN